MTLPQVVSQVGKLRAALKCAFNHAVGPEPPGMRPNPSGADWIDYWRREVALDCRFYALN